MTLDDLLSTVLSSTPADWASIEPPGRQYLEQIVDEAKATLYLAGLVDRLAGGHEFDECLRQSAMVPLPEK